MDDNNAEERNEQVSGSHRPWSAAEHFLETTTTTDGDCDADPAVAVHSETHTHQFAPHMSQQQRDDKDGCAVVFSALVTEMQQGKENPVHCVTPDAVVLRAAASVHLVQTLRCQTTPVAAPRRQEQEPEEQEREEEKEACASEPKPSRTMDTSAIENCERTSTAMSLQDFEKLGFLGMGGAAVVYLVRHRASRVVYAMKMQQISRSDPGNRQTQRAVKEQQILETLQHPFVARLHFAFELKHHFMLQDGDNLCLVMEFCEGGSLKDLHEFCGGTLSEHEVLFYAAEVVLALEYVHTMGFVYRDLKPENILLGKDGHIRLTDFGVAQRGEPIGRADTDAPNTTKFQIPQYRVDDRVRLRSNSFVGTMDYMPPEMILQKSHQSTDLDWWALGCLLYELLFGVTPFQDNEKEAQGNQDDPAALFKKVVKCQVSFPATPKVSEASKDLIRKLLVKDPRKRLGHRAGADEIKQHTFFKGTEWALLGHMEPPVAVTCSETLCFQRFRPENLGVEVAHELACFEEHLGLSTSTDFSQAPAAVKLWTFRQERNHGDKSDDGDCNQIQMVSTPSSISSSGTLDEDADRFLDDQSHGICQCATHSCSSTKLYQRKAMPTTTDRSRSFKNTLRQLSDSFRQPSHGTKEVAMALFSSKVNANKEALNAWNTFTNRAAAFLSDHHLAQSKA
ncbi:Agc protein kinase, partial [Globisporangium splendens]